jgi:hypothetical protein
MKFRLTRTSALLTTLISLHISQLLSQTSTPATASWPGWMVTSMDQNSTTRVLTNLAAAAANPLQAPTVVELGSGLNYQTASGDFLPSQDLVELLPDGSAAAAHGPLTVHFSPDLSSDTAIIFNLGSLTLQTHPIGLYYFDPVSGTSVLLLP